MRVDTRYDRERDFFDDEPEHARHRVGKYYRLTSRSTETYEGLLRTLAPGRRVLEIGCGKGETAIRLAELGAEVTAVDISPRRIEHADRRAKAMQVSVAFEVANAERLRFEDSTFDLVCGQAVLHHLDVDAAFAEAARVLRPRGRGVFIEPLGHNPAINAYRRLTPGLRTPDEHPMRMDEIAAARRYFGVVRVRYFHLTSFAALLLAGSSFFDPAVAKLEALDDSLFRRFRLLGRYAWRGVVFVEAPR